ncbi:SARP family transcriptional regulator [Dactylosporangium sucinum]|uniref:SARP family transcriptional regulator n=2 Tax=Dactylosporangium sucinum TaxID=1424081 RepID=A0A917TQD1_9ACTN|nr:SARP family transcriptional regulator [Dactylosporangium sucinum]
MDIRLLGPLEVRDREGRTIDIGGARLRLLLILLALEPGKVVTAGRLIDGIWGDQPPAGAGNALQSLVSRLRRLLPDGVLHARPAGYLLDVDPDDVDCFRFERQPQAAGELWRGTALADAGDAPWATSWRVRFDELRLTVAEAGTPDIPELEALAAAHPHRERIAGLLMRALHQQGRTPEALMVFERYRRRLADELGTDPAPSLARLHLELLRAGEPAVQGNLRTPLTSFVGRDVEVRNLARTVASNRLVTLVGPGGAGKTRLSLEAGRALAPAPPDGVWLVELAPVTAPADVVQAVWAALGMRDPAGGAAPGLLAAGRDGSDSTGRLCNALALRRLTIVLDNCEHVVAAAAELADRLLGAGPDLHVLATSREPLGITGEVLHPVEPLPLPPADADPASARDFASVLLFLDRAALVRPELATDRDSVAAMVRICRALDGMPLAIELAAARCRTLAPAQIADRLDDRFRLLTRGSRTALPRHQTLRATVDWSWDLLDAAERAMLRRLAVFPGGATLESAAAVCDPGGELGDPLELLTTLVDKSLLLVDDAGRYRMLETIRAYGLERLDEQGETAALRARHGAWFLDLIERLEGRLRTRDQLAALAAISAEHDNVHGALRRAIADGDAATATRFVAGVGWYWWLGGHRVEGAALAAAALMLPGEVDPDVRALACGVAAVNGFDGLGDTTMLNDWFREALTYRGPNSMFRLFEAVAGLFRDGPTPEVMARIERLADDPEPWTASLGHLLHGHTLLNVGGRFGEAAGEFRASLDGFRALGERWGMAFALAALAEVIARDGRHEEAIGHFEEALRYLRELGATEDRPVTEVRLAQLYGLLGRFDKAEETLAEARRTAQRSGVPDSIAFVEYAFAHRALRLGDLDQARARFAHALALVGDHRVSPQMMAMLTSGRALLLALDGDRPAAGAALREAFAHARASFDAPVVGTVLDDAAEIALLLGDPARAVTLAAGADAVRGGPDRTRPWTAAVAARAGAALGDADRAAATSLGAATTIDTVDRLLAAPQ